MFKDSQAFSSFSVNDLHAAKTFYAETLGLDVNEEDGFLNVQLAGGSAVLVYGKEDHLPATFTVLNFSVPQVESAVAALNQKGVKFEIYHDGELQTDDQGISRADGQAIAWFKDPAGNILSLMETR
ncbi:MAG: VOC family protein [Chloroflexota bacterium]|nr:VOC family protein [Chloroflexota bacterium]